ncbi:MAG: YheU family protein [Gammaproteobacteria bacterium TMED92]|nr:MAG: YheU family protein [Gammaproteobacteria bacterium TMED92]
MKIPQQQLSQDALLGVIDAFILREGTDYGEQEYTLEEKRQRVLTQLQRGDAEIHFHPENEHIDIVRVK